MKYLTAWLKGRMWRTRETMTGLIRPPGVSARPGGPLFSSEWEDILEADSVGFVKTMKATHEHEVQNNAVVIHRWQSIGLLFWTYSNYFPNLTQCQKVTLSFVIMTALVASSTSLTVSGHVWVWLDVKQTSPFLDRRCIFFFFFFFNGCFTFDDNFPKEKLATRSLEELKRSF